MVSLAIQDRRTMRVHDMDIPATASTETLRELICETTGLGLNSLIIRRSATHGVDVGRDVTLACAGLVPATFPHSLYVLAREDGPTFCVFVITGYKQAKTVEVHGWYTGANLKCILQAQYKFCPENCYLVRSGRILDDCRKLADYRVVAGAHIHLMFRACSVQCCAK